MKKTLKLALALLCCAIVSVVLMVACTPAKITVTFDPNYEGATMLPRTGSSGNLFEAPTVTRNGYEFDGWYKNKALSGTPEVFPQRLTENTTFYAKWNQITSKPDPTPTPTPTPEPVVLVSISAVYSGDELLIGATLNENLVSVIATYSDNSSKQVSGFNLSAITFEVAGTHTVTVTYTENEVTKTATFTVTVVEPVVLQSITATYSGTNVIVGNQPDQGLLMVTAHYSNGSSKNVTNYAVGSFDSSTVGEKDWEISYTDGGITKSVIVKINVIEPVVLQSITATYSGANVIVGNQPDQGLLTVTAHYSNGSSKNVTNYAVGPFDSSTVGEKDWEISYTDGGVTKSVIVKINVIEPKEPQENVYDVEVISNENLSIHFLELGNGSIGDSIYIKAGETDILIDAGSKRNSAPTLANYINQYCEDGILEYVIATHAHEDHIAGFVGEGSNKGIFDLFKCGVIIDFTRKNTTSIVSADYITKRNKEVEEDGAKHYTAKDCIDNTNGASKIYELADGITMEILNQKYYHQSTSNENDYSVCVLISQGDNHYLFTGDLEKAGEESLVQLNPNLPQVELYKGGHHGSSTSSNEVLMKKIQPKCVCVCSCVGSVEYSQNVYSGTFPTQDFINRVAPYTDKVYVTTYMSVKNNGNSYSNDKYSSMNGNIVFACTDGQITMYFSNNNLKLKDTDWFKQYRTCPSQWL
ncbi:MAG: InlB B-repeat-containing protein [Clostridiales bacterium]|nr:InlB B-repeat-containing protein [Clostridiales bacterium]